MAKKNKDFDCVEMKQDAQRKLWEEYESRKGEFASYVEFISAKAKTSQLLKDLRANAAKAHATKD
jgi:hypothetical protein